MCIIDLPDPGLMRAVELADFMDEVDSADPELLTLGPGAGSPRSPDAVLMSARVGQCDYRIHGANGADDSDWDAAARSPPTFSRGFPASGSSCGDATAWGVPHALASPAKEPAEDSPRSPNALPQWMVPDDVVIESCLDRLLAKNAGVTRAASPPTATGARFAPGAASVSGQHAMAHTLTVSVGNRNPRTPPSSFATGNLGLGSSKRHGSAVAAAAAASQLPAELISFRLKDAERSRMRRKRQKNEFAQLRLRIRELEEELAILRRQDTGGSALTLEQAIGSSHESKAGLVATKSEPEDMVVDSDDGDTEADALAAKLSEEKMWGQLASHHKEELQKSRVQNLRLRAEAEQQLRVLKQIEVALRTLGKMTPAQRRGLKSRGVFRNESAVFDFLRVNLASLFMETDRMFKASGLADFDGDMVQMGVPHAMDDASPGPGNVLYVENMDSKVCPFILDTVAQASWRSLTSSDPAIHPGFYKIVEATDDMVTVKIVDYVRFPGSETLVTVWLNARRYREDERVVTVWNAFVELEGPVYMKLYERGWNVLRPLLPTNESRNPSMCVLQTLMRVTPELTETFAPEEVAPDSLGLLLMGCYHRTVIMTHHVLEKLLLTESGPLSSS